MNNVFFVVDCIAALAYITTGKLRFNRWLNPTTLFSTLWMIVAAGSNLCLFGHYGPSTYVNMGMIIGSLFFHVTLLATPPNLISGKKVPTISIADFNQIRFGTIVSVNLILLILTMPLITRAIAIIADSGWSNLRMLNYSSESYKSTFETYLLTLVVEPCSMATVTIGLISTLGGYRKGPLILSVGIITSIILSLTSAGRIFLIRTPILLVFLFLIDGRLSSSKAIAKLFNNKMLVAITIGIIALVLAITSDRSSSRDSFFSIFYSYHFAGPVYLSKLLEENIPGFMVDKNSLFGWATFGFLINLPITIGLVLGLSIRPSTYWIGSYITSRQLPIGEQVYSNAMCTCYYDFLLDWGTIGFIIGPVILAFATIEIRKNLEKKNNVFWFSIQLFWMYCLYRTVFRWDLVGVDATIVILFLLLFTKSGRNQNKESKLYDHRQGSISTGSLS